MKLHQLIETAKETLASFSETEAYHDIGLKAAKDFQAALKELFKTIADEVGDDATVYVANGHRWQIEPHGGVWDVMSQRWAFRGDLEDSKIWFWLRTVDIDAADAAEIRWLFGIYRTCKEKKYI